MPSHCNRKMLANINEHEQRTGNAVIHVSKKRRNGEKKKKLCMVRPQNGVHNEKKTHPQIHTHTDETAHLVNPATAAPERR